jgi:hypothetical protein
LTLRAFSTRKKELIEEGRQTRHKSLRRTDEKNTKDAVCHELRRRQFEFDRFCRYRRWAIAREDEY